MIKGSTFSVTSGALPSPPVIAKVPLRSLLSMKQKPLIAASATTSTPSPTTLPPSSTMSISKRKTTAKKSASLLNLLTDYGFDDSQIQILIESRVVQLNAQRILKPKLDYLVENGFTGELLHNLIVSSPEILRRSLDASIKPRFQLLKQYLDSDEKVVTAITRARWMLYYDLKRYLVPNIELLVKMGVPVNRVSHLLVTHPRIFLLSRDKVAYAVKTVKEFGIAPDESQFICCLRLMCQLSEPNLKKKVQVFKSFGWSDEQVSNVFKKWPSCLCLSEEKLRSKIGFYVNTVKLEPDIVVYNPLLLTYKVKRVHARYEVLKILNSKNLISGMPIKSAVAISEYLFKERYVIKYVERVPGILDMYNGIVNEGKNKQGKKN